MTFRLFPQYRVSFACGHEGHWHHLYSSLSSWLTRSWFVFRFFEPCRLGKTSVAIPEILIELSVIWRLKIGGIADSSLIGDEAMLGLRMSCNMLAMSPWRRWTTTEFRRAKGRARFFRGVDSQSDRAV